MIECLKDGWCEPPAISGLHLSTLLHQILALILQKSGIRPQNAYRILCERGPFRTIDKALFADLLRCMASEENKLIEQSPDGLLMIGENGEKITESHEFYPLFATEREYRILHEARFLGNYPLDSAIKNGETLIFAGRRWLVLEVDDAARVISVRPNKGGKPPRFSGNGGNIHDYIVNKMREVLSTQDAYPCIDRVAGELLASARQVFRELELDRRNIIPYGDGVIVFPWVGTKKLTTLALAFQSREFKTTPLAFAIELQACETDGVAHYAKAFSEGDVPSTDALMSGVSKPNVAKFDGFLSWDLMTLLTVRERLEIDQLPALARRLGYLARDLAGPSK